MFNQSEETVNRFNYGLAHFCGSTEFYRHPLNSNLKYTEGVEYFAQHMGGGAYWFLDLVASELADLMETEEFLTVVLDVKPDTTAELRVEDGNGGVLFPKTIPFTDAFVGEWKFFLVNNILLLPREY